MHVCTNTEKISEVIHLSDKHHDDPEHVASRKLLSLSNINVRQLSGKVIVNYEIL